MNDKGNILVVDDDAGMCETLCDIIEEEGYRAVSALSGEKAIGRVQEEPFDVVLMDVKMPGMDGVEAFKQIKRIRPEAAVIMMTGYTVPELIQEALQEGAYGVVYKPLDVEKVLTLIQDIRGGGLILVVDDDPHTCITFKDILEAKGYEVATALSGEEALEIARQGAHDVIFVDMKLPAINGLETYLAIRDIDPQAVAVMMTAYRQEMGGLVEEALSKDAYACLYKPFDVGEVIKLVREICRRKRASGV